MRYAGMNLSNEAQKALYDACKEFVRKVESGEARSRRSYEQMKKAIELAEEKND
jgi:hypothetical protein